MIESIDSTSCCGMWELSGFYSDDPGNQKSWMRTLRNVLVDSELYVKLPAIILFSGAEYQIEGHTPFGFAKWLKRQGEVVVNTPKVINGNSGKKIQAFLWAPSKRFQKKLIEFHEKEEEEKANNGRNSEESRF